jgi:hypothetical protein
MSCIYDELPIIWQETWNKLNNNHILQQAIEEMYQNNKLDEIMPQAFFNGEIEQQFINTCGMTSEQIIKLQRGEKVNIIELINRVYKELELSSDDYKYNLKHINDELFEITFNHIESNKIMIIEFNYDSNYLVNEVFITKNTLFYGNNHKKIFEIFTSEACIDFIIRPIIKI